MSNRIISLLSFLVILITSCFFYIVINYDLNELFSGQGSDSNVVVVDQKQEEHKDSSTDDDTIDDLEPSIVLDNLEDGDIIISPFVITGKALGSWYFEGSFNVFLEDSSGRELTRSIVSTSDDWMKESYASFSTVLNFTALSNPSATVVFEKANPSGLEQNTEQFRVPVFFESKSTNIRIFFSNTTRDPEMKECGKVYFATRSVSIGDSLIETAIDELLKNTNKVERQYGFVSQIKNDVELNNFTVKGRIVSVDFNSHLYSSVSNDCEKRALIAQITQTITQFGDIDSVDIFINGEKFE